MTDEIYIFGHKNPDTDSICSSIAYAEFKNKIGFKNAKPYRLGQINKETDFVLDYFKVPKPELLEDIKLKVKDLSLYKPFTLFENDPLKKAWDNLKTSEGSRIIPIVDENTCLEGIISMGDIAKMFISLVIDNNNLNYEILFKNLIQILDAEHVYGNYNYEKIEGKLYIGSTALCNKAEITDKDIVITANIETAKIYAMQFKIGCVILVDNIFPQGLENSKSAIIQVNKDLYNTIILLNQAVSIRSVMKKNNMITFLNDSKVEDIIDTMKTSSHRNFPVIDRNNKLIGIISRRHLLQYNKKKVILMDHNEKAQSIDGIDDAHIIEIIDHHRIADIQTEFPLYIRSEPVGCTSTIVYKMFKEHNVEIDNSTKGILLSAILSDTLMFTSPTCTSEDKEIGLQLEKDLDINIKDYSISLFTASTSLEGYTPLEILMVDLKKFSFGKHVFAISQINTLDFNSIVKQKQGLLDSMKTYLEKNNCDMVILMITDITISGSEILIVGNSTKQIAEKAFNLSKNQESIFLNGIVSRKKQLVPKLSAAVSML